MAAVDVINAYLGALPGESRRVAPGEWGLTLAADSAGGYPLDVGLRLHDGTLEAKAAALSDSAGLDPWMLLWWNRQTRYVRFACTQSKEVWVHGDLPVAAVEERQVDRLLGLVVEGAIAVREFQAASRLAPKEPDAAGGSWLTPGT